MRTTLLLSYYYVLILHTAALLVAVQGFQLHRRVVKGARSRTTRLLLASNVNSQKRNLYDVLGARGTESRAELKKLYVSLAKQTHPDAQVNSNSTTTLSTSTTALDFSEIAAAWQILGNDKARKQYDRSLQAEQFSNDVVSWATEIGAPAAVNSFQKVVLPFVRRATATTLAGIEAGLNEGKKDATNQKKKADLGSTVRKAMAAAERANKAVDDIEALERADELDRQSAIDRKKAEAAQEQILKVEAQRVRLVLHTPHSGLTSADAASVLEEFNQTVTDKRDGFLFLFKNSIQEDIQELTESERDFLSRQTQDRAAQQAYQASLETQYRHKNHHANLKRQQKALMEQLQQVQKQLLDSKANVTQSKLDLSKAAYQAERSSWELERQSTVLGKQSEKVRKALWQREREVLSELKKSQAQKVNGEEGTTATDGNSEKLVMEAFPDEESEDRLQEIEQLRAKARSLARDTVYFGKSATRLQERAKQLRESAEAKNGAK